jgi:hypothetical protein
VISLEKLLLCILAESEFDLRIALYHGEFAAVSAQMEHWGVPLDQEKFVQLADKATWRAIRDAMVPAIDANYGVYVRGANGDWSWNNERFKGYLEREGIAWPLLESGKHDLKDQTFREMCKGYPQIEPLRQLRHVRNKMRKVKLTVGVDGRNRTVLWPFQAKTSRTQPKASQWIFSPAVWLRFLIKTGAENGGRLYRLQFDGVSDRCLTVGRSLRAAEHHARNVSKWRSIFELCKGGSRRAAGGDQTIPRGDTRQVQGGVALDTVCNFAPYASDPARGILV